MKMTKAQKRFSKLALVGIAALCSTSMLIPLLAKDKEWEKETKAQTQEETSVQTWDEFDHVGETVQEAETVEAPSEAVVVEVTANGEEGFQLIANDQAALRWETADNGLFVVAKNISAVSAEKINLFEKPDAGSKRVGEMLPYTAGYVTEEVKDESGDWYHIVSGAVSGYARAAFFATGSEAYAQLNNAENVMAGDGEQGLNVMSVTLGVANAVSDMIPEEIMPEATQGATITVKENGNGLRTYSSQNYTQPAYSYQPSYSANSQPVNQPPADNNWASLAGTTDQRKALVQRALSFVGRPYVLGGNDPYNGVDCSGFVRYLYRELGIELPRRSAQQAEVDARVALGEIKPGDLVFYANNGKVYHVAMYIGDGRIVHAKNEESGIVTDNLSGREYRAISLLP